MLVCFSQRGHKSAADEDGRHGATADMGRNYRIAYFQDFDGKYYQCTISVEMSANRNAVYNIGKMKERSFPSVQKALNGSSTNGGAQRGKTSSADSIRSKNEKVNTSQGPVKQDISSAKTKFSMESPVEETDTLIALHNMDETGLRTTLKLGAWPSPSIAIVKAKQGHSKFGEYSAIFPRSTIDPETNSQNNVYGSDAWTPTRGDAQVEYEVNYDKKLKAESHINELSKKIAGGIFAKSSTISSIVDDVSTDDTEALARRLAGTIQ